MMTDSIETCPWKLLGVTPDDDAATIRRAWRALVRSYHPDLATTDREAANRKLAEINAAYDLVIDPEAAKRRLEEERARRAEAARQAEAARRAEAARKAEADRRAEAEEAARRTADASTAASRMPVLRPANWSRADRHAARAARSAFELARRVFEGQPPPRRPAVYL